MLGRVQRFGKRGVAMALLATFSIELFVPHMGWALTSGPTTPETTSFEPVDTTDMVNLQTGDFTYNMPLLEVPGPEGGYPLALSYHAGILPDEDASWVGLGWSLSPGALTRNVNGYPDDWYSQQQTVRDYWSGGVNTTHSVGVSVGIPGPIGNVGFGLDFSQDTYRGFGIGMSVSSILYQAGPTYIGATAGISAYGNPYAGVNVGVGFSSSMGLNMDASVGLGISSGGLSAGMSGGVGYGLQNPTEGQPSMKFSLLGASIGTGGTKPSLQVGGIGGRAYNATAGKIQTQTSGFSFGIPIWYGINVQYGYSKTRYWSDETAGSTVHGSIHASGWTAIDNRAYDTYSLLEASNGKNIVDHPDPTRVAGGSYPDFDVYSVHAQGLAGNIRPYLLKGEVLSQNRKTYDGSNETPAVTYYSPAPTNSAPVFRFVHDFSNSYRQQYPMNNPALNLPIVNPSFDPTPQYGNNDDNYGFGGGNKLAGSKHIETYIQGQTPIKPRNAKGYNANWVRTVHSTGVPNASSVRARLIEGFSITNESGVTYHFSLPAYSYREEIYQEKINADPDNLSFNRHTKTEPYAYTWHLTAITGPDYVDRNNNKIVDEDDWGYWVSFEYGRWTGDYVWRNPGTDYHRDEDNEFKAMSIGTKEVYYLNAIRTRSHIAVFEKDFRLDGKSVASSNYIKAPGAPGPKYAVHGVYDQTSRHSMRLDRIYLFNATDSLAINPSRGGTSSTRTNACSNCEFPQHVVDRRDVDLAGRSQIEVKALRIIDFKHDYSLCKGTPNSFDINSVGNKFGKLSLQSVQFRGKGGAAILPPTDFGYGDNDDVSIGAIFQNPSTFMSTAYLEPGEMVETLGGDFRGVITRVTGNGFPTYTYTLSNGQTSMPAGSSGSGGLVSVSMRRTKNPPYHSGAKDIWGYYKSDHNANLVEENYNLGKKTTEVSSKSTDAWSLRSISSYLGSKINVAYESDSYSSQTFGNEMSLIMYSVRFLSHDKIEFTLSPGHFNEDVVLEVGNTYSSVMSIAKETESPHSSVTGAGKVMSPKLNVISRNGNTYTATSNENFMLGSLGRAFYGTGNISFKANLKNFGGGIRVKHVELTSFGGNVTKCHYLYHVESSGLCTGTISYPPSILPIYNNAYFSLVNPYGYEGAFRARLYRTDEQVYTLARELPPPIVMYEYVTVTNENRDQNGHIRHSEGKVVYQFERLRENMVGMITTATQRSGTRMVRNQVLKKFLTAIGNVKKISTYDALGNLIRETENHYLHDGLHNQTLQNFMSNYELRLAQFNYQGVIKERVHEVKNVRFGSVDSTFSVFSAKEEFPCIQTGTTHRDYITGVTTKTHVKAFDFYSGSMTETLEEDGYGNRFLTEQIPAYRKYPEMGLRVNTSGNKNMLNQMAGSVIYKVDADDTKTAVVGASAQTWSKTLPVLEPDGTGIVQNNLPNGNVWRMSDSYSWMPVSSRADGLTALSSFLPFNWTTPASSHAHWTKTGGISRYNVYSKALEAYDINGHYMATRLGYRSSKVTVSGGPAKYGEIAFSGAEDETVIGENPFEVRRGDGTVSTAHAHTGTSSLSLGSGKSGFEYTQSAANLTTGRDYIASVWVRSIGTASNAKLYYQINGMPKETSPSSSVSTKRSGDWVLLTLPISGADIATGATLHVGVRNDHAADVFVDDFRFQPANAATTAYVYDPFTGDLTYMLDDHNLYTRYEYDDAGRLRRILTERFGGPAYKSAEFELNFARPLYWSSEHSGIFTKTNCLTGYEGIPITYVVPSGKYSSDISQTDADAKAALDVQQNGQTYANQYGGCQVSSTCKTLRVKIPSSVLQQYDGELFIGYTSCGNSFPNVVSIHHLPADLDENCLECHVLEVCVSNHSSSIYFYASQYGAAMDIPAIIIEEIGPCN